MKLGTLLSTIPVYQDIILLEYSEPVAEGRPTSQKVIEHKNKTVGLIAVEDNKLKINVYDR